MAPLDGIVIAAYFLATIAMTAGTCVGWIVSLATWNSYRPPTNKVAPS
jgi:hypothetical protein